MAAIQGGAKRGIRLHLWEGKQQRSQVKTPAVLICDFRDLELMESLVAEVEKNVDGQRISVEGEDDNAPEVDQ